MTEKSARGAAQWRSKMFSSGPLGRLLGNSAILLGGKFMQGLFSLGSTALAVRALGAEGFGLLVMVHAYTAIVGEVAKFQSWQAVLRYGMPALEEGRVEDLQKLVKFTGALDVASAVLATAVSALGVLLIAPLLHWPEGVRPLAMGYSLSLLFIATATPLGLLRLFDRFDIMAMQQSVEALVRLIGAAAAFFLGWGLPAFLIIWFCARVVAGIVLVTGAAFEYRRRDLMKGMNWTLRGIRKPFPGIWRFVLATNFTTTAAATTNHLGPLVIGGLAGPAAAGLLRIAERLAEAVAKPTKMLIPAIYPEIARMVVRAELGELKRLLLRSAGFAFAGAVVAMTVLVLFGPFLLRLIGGENAVTAHLVLVLLGLAALTLLVAFSVEPTLITIGRPGAALVAQLLGFAVYVATLFALTPTIGLLAAGVAALASAVVIVAARFLPVARWFREQERRG